MEHRRTRDEETGHECPHRIAVRDLDGHDQVVDIGCQATLNRRVCAARNCASSDLSSQMPALATDIDPHRVALGIAASSSSRSSVDGGDRAWAQRRYDEPHQTGQTKDRFQLTLVVPCSSALTAIVDRLAFGCFDGVKRGRGQIVPRLYTTLSEDDRRTSVVGGDRTPHRLTSDRRRPSSPPRISAAPTHPQSARLRRRRSSMIGRQRSAEIACRFEARAGLPSMQAADFAAAQRAGCAGNEPNLLPSALAVRDPRV